jgi:phosphate transport system substrate-binding protein
MRPESSFAGALACALYVVAVQAADVTGAGSTFAEPIYTRWASEYRVSGGGKVTYTGTGSHDGLKQVIAKTVDFAGSDAPLTEDELAKNGLLQFPTVVGGVVPVVNLPDIKPGELTLSGQVLSDIYLGKVTSWNDPEIAALNPKLKLPDTAIAVIRRADGSGTSLIWTHFLSQVSPEWRAKVGEGPTVRWPRGIGGKGNEGVATFVRYLPGAIGYVAWDFTKHNHLAFAAMRNASGTVVQPGPNTFKAACADVDWSRSFYQILTNQPGNDAWPVVGATFVLVHTAQERPEHDNETLKFFNWALNNGRQSAQDLDYVPLPDSAVAAIRLQWNSRIKDASGKALADH